MRKLAKYVCSAVLVMGLSLFVFCQSNHYEEDVVDLYMKGIEQFHQEAYDDANRTFDSLITSGQLNSKGLAGCHYLKGLICKARGKYQEAAENFSRSLVHDINNHTVKASLAANYANLGKSAEAIERLEHLLSENIDKGTKFSIVSEISRLCYDYLGDSAKALEAAEKALKYTETDDLKAGYYELMGDIYQFSIRDPHKALGYYEKSLSLPLEEKCRRSTYQALFCLYANYKELWDKDKILKYAQRVDQIEKTTHSTINLSTAYAAAGNLDEARRLIQGIPGEKLLDSDGWSVACVYSLLDETDMAIQWLNREIASWEKLGLPIEARQSRMNMIKTDATLENVRKDRRFIGLDERALNPTAEQRVRPGG